MRFSELSLLLVLSLCACIRNPEIPGRDASVNASDAAVVVADAAITDAARIHDASVSTGVDAATSNAADASADGGAIVAPVVLDDDALEDIDPNTLLAASSPCRTPVLKRVTHITDGDTVGVTDPAGGNYERIRMIGVNAPEIAHSAEETDQCYGPEATDFTAQLYGHLVWLTFDTLCTDPYDRTLAFVWAGGRPTDMWTRQLLRNGLGRAFVIGSNRVLQTIAPSDQADAEAANVGMWSACE